MRNGANRSPRIPSWFKLKGARSGDHVTVAWVDNLGNKNTTDAVIAA